jgi:3-hydroxyacyl-[acyl-carrier-protein] dehydratase
VPTLSTDQIKAIIPHRDPFLWIDEVVELDPPTRLVATKFLRPDLDVFRGHYPNSPIMPGVLMCEACLQGGAILIAHHPEGAIGPGQVPVATRINNVKFKRMVRPGDTLTIEITFTERLGTAFFMTGRVRVGDSVAVTLDFAASAAEKSTGM